MLRGIFWIQVRGSERRMELKGIFGHKREVVREGWCSGQYLDPREGN